MNTTPWRLVGGSKLLWFVRFEVIREYEIKRAQLEKTRSKTSGLDEINARQKRRR
jgi:hypothetical protein